MIGVITNPNSKKNRRRPHRAAELRDAVGSMGIVRQTRDTSEIAGVLHEFEDRGVDVWVSDGGDGALHWMLNTGRTVLVERGHAPGTLRPVVPANGGTIDFVAKKAGVRGSAVQILQRLASLARRGQCPRIVELDSLWIEGDPAVPASPLGRLGFACAIAGVGQRFFSRYYEYPNPGPRTIIRVVARGVASWLLGAWPLAALPGVPDRFRAYARDIFRPAPARVTIDGELVAESRFTALNAGSIDVDLGGVIRVFPLARDKGSLDFQAGAPSPMHIIRSLPDLYRGRGIHIPELTEQTAERMDVRATTDELLDPVIDGELTFGYRELRIRRGPVVPVAVA